MIYAHPTVTNGYLKGTEEVIRLINAEYTIPLPTGEFVHPLYFTPPDFIEPQDLAAAKAYGVEYVNRRGDDKAMGLDDTLWFSQAQLPLEFAADELNRWYVAGQPANPAGGQYKIANKLGVIRGETTGATMTWMAGKWQALYVSVSDLIAQRYSFIQRINAAVDIAAVEVILAEVEAW